MNVIDPALTDYIHASRLVGGGGWQPVTLDEAFSISSLIARAPIPPVSELQAAPAVIPVPKPNTSSFAPTTHSPFSITLAAILFVFLLVLGYHAIGDLDDLFTSVSAELVIDVIIIIPFILLAIGLHTALLHEKSRYRSLTVPFFAASAWLVFKLIIDVSQYLYSNGAVYGVYIVLLIVAVVLTATTIILQKYKGRI
jgi:hypothetical protein